LLFVATLFTRRETGRNLLENSEIHATVLSQQRSELLVENSVFHTTLYSCVAFRYFFAERHLI